jgi:hypothetical protein
VRGNGCAKMNWEEPRVIPLRTACPVKRQDSRKAIWLGYAISVLAGIPRRRRRPNTGDLQRQDCSLSTQRMGVSFTDIIRDTFRFRWLRKAR